jgi:hypothetical protein
VIVLPGGRTITHFWGDPGYEVIRSGGRPLIETSDDRFAYRFTDYAASGLPIVLYEIDSAGRLVDVTRSYPSLIRADAARWWKAYLAQRGGRDQDARGVLASWCADQYMLGQQQACTTELARAARHGWIGGPPEWPASGRYLALLHRTLAAWGYGSTR